VAKYFFTSLANRPMTLSGRIFRFDVCSIQGGKAAGVYEATDAEEIKVLEEAVAARRGVKEIGEAEFELLKKKLTLTPPSRSSNVSRPRVVRIPTLPEVSMEAKIGVPSAASGASKPGVNPEENLLVAPPISKLVRVERVNPPRPFATADQKVVKASKRAARAKVRVARSAEQ
jgi:hypothetical protein